MNEVVSYSLISKIRKVTYDKRPAEKAFLTAQRMRGQGRPKGFFQIVSAFIWRCGLRANEQVPGEEEHDLMWTACLFSKIQ